MKHRDIDGADNYYGGVAVKEKDGKFYWSVENCDCHHWHEIPKYLFDALNKHQDEQENKG